MKQRLQLGVWILVSLTVFGGMAQAQNGPIAIVDMNRVFEEYERTINAKQKMEQQGAMFKAEVTEQAEQLRGLEEEFNLARQEAYDMALSAEVRDERKAEAEQMLLKLRDKEAEVKALQETRRKEMGDTSNRLIEGILKEIKGRVDAYGAANGYFLVLDSSGSTFNRLPAVVYHDGSAEITDSVLAVLNASADVESEATTEEE